MTNTIRRLLAHPGRYLGVLASALAVAAATIISLTAGSSPRPDHDATPHPTSVPDAPTDIPSRIPPAPHLPTSGAPQPPPNPPVAAQTTPASRTTTTSTPAPATPSAGAKEPEDLLKRQDPVPDGVAEQVQFFLGGGRDPDCTPDYAGPPYITGADKIVEIPTALILCFYGFKEALPLTVTFTDPSRPETTVLLPPAENFFWTEFRGFPTDPVGPYSVRAEQDALNASLEFTLQHANSPRLLLVRPPEPTEAGVDVDLYLGGFPPDSQTLLHLYNADTRRYRTSFTAPIDAFGEAHVVIDTKPDDPPGCYGIISPLTYDPGVIPESGFCIE
jgi:hypothetical protein